MVAALESGRSSWTALLDAVRLRPEDNVTEVTAAQIREVIDRLVAAGQWTHGDPDILIVFDAGYDGARLAWLLADLPVALLVRVRSDRVFHAPGGPRGDGRAGRPSRHGQKMKLKDTVTHLSRDAHAATDTPRYGHTVIEAWGRRHQRLTRDGGWVGHDGELPIIEGTLLRICVERLPGDRAPKPLWLWHSQPDCDGVDLVGLFAAFCRRFDLEHTFRFLKQTLGWTRPRIRTPEQADRWTWLIIAAHTQLRLARDLTDDLRRPWEKPITGPGRLTPARVRRGFQRLRPKIGVPTRPPKPSRPGPGRPTGSTSGPAPRYPVGKKNSKRTKKDTDPISATNPTG